MNTATQIRRHIQAIALRTATNSIDSKEATETCRKLWDRADRLNVGQEVRRQLELCARGRMV